MPELQLKLSSLFQDPKTLEFTQKNPKQQAVDAAQITSTLQSWISPDRFLGFFSPRRIFFFPQNVSDTHTQKNPVIISVFKEKIKIQNEDLRPTLFLSTDFEPPLPSCPSEVNWILLPWLIKQE